MKRVSSSYAIVRRHFAMTQLFVFVTGLLHVTLLAQAGTFTVTNTNDSGTGSLRQAIVDSNASPGLDTIEFNIPGGGVKTIRIDNTLTGISSPVIIDGYTQPGSSSNTLAAATDAVLLVEITTTNSSQGINFQTSGCTARGLAINGFAQGITFQAMAKSNVVEGCFIGTDPTGSLAGQHDGGNSTGINCASAFNRIGGTEPWQRNLISGNTSGGILLPQSAFATDNIIQNNIIGLSADGQSALPNDIGVELYGNHNLIGGPTANARNVISGNSSTAIYIVSGKSNTVQNCYLGTDLTGTALIPNGSGIEMNAASYNQITGNTIGGSGSEGISVANSTFNKMDGNFIGTDSTGSIHLGNDGTGIAIGGVSNTIGAVTGNLIAFNGNRGISLDSGSADTIVANNTIYTNATQGILVNTLRNKLTANSIFENGNHGIDLIGDGGPDANDNCDTDAGGNNLQNYPVLTNVITSNSVTTVTGFLPSAASTTYRVEFFANNNCDPSGFGEGQFYLGYTNLTTAANCTGTFTFVTAELVTGCDAITATATDPSGNTSEFTPCMQNIVESCVTPPSDMVGWWSGDGNVIDLIAGNNGILTNGATYAAGKVGQAFSLNGTSAYVVSSNSAAIDPTTAGSQDAWVYFNQLPSAAGHIMQIIGKGSSGRDFDLQANTDNRFHFYIGAGTQVASTTVISTGVWYHVTGTWDSTVGLNLYVNGQLEATNPTQLTRLASDEPLQIGNQPAFGPRLFNGLIDEVEIYNRALTPTEVRQIACSGSYGKCKPDITNNIPPQITCPSNITTNTASGQCSRAVSFTTIVTGTPTPTVTCTPPSGSVFLSGSELVSCVASNSAGIDSCNFTVTVNDLQSPTVNCPVNITTNVPAGVTSANVTFLTPTGSDNCAISQVVCAPSSGSSFALGTTPVTCTATDTNDNTGQCNFNVTVTQSAASANLGITKTVDSPTIALGSNVVYTVTVTNAGPNTAESVVVGDALPGLLDFVSATPTQGDCAHNDGLVSCNLGALAAGGVAGIQIEAGTRGIGTNCNYAVVSSLTTDPVSANNRAGACTVVYRPVTGADLSLTKASIPDSMIVSNTAVFEVRVQNLGPDTAEAVQINDVLPAGLEFVGVITTRGSCVENVGTVTCDLGTLGVQSNATVQVTVRGVELGEICNAAEATSVTEDPLLSNNADEACVEVREDQEKDHDLAVTKITAPHTVTFTGVKTRVRERVGVQIQNRGPHAETIKNATVLADLVTLTADSLGSCPAPEIKLTVGSPQVALPLRLDPKQKATVWFDVKFVRDCVNDPEQSSAADPGHEDYRWIAVVDHAAINGKEDTNPADDVCPRYGRPPFERTPNAPTTIREKGCGDNAPDGSARGGDVLTDVVVP